MPTNTERLNLTQPLVDDDIQKTIVRLADNFKIIDDNFDETITDIRNFLKTGTLYRSGKKFWNRNPSIGGYAGWTNIREGVFAPYWKKQTTYKVGDKVGKNPDNGHWYECIASGTSAINQPVFSTLTGATMLDLDGHVIWTASYVYSLDDIVVSTVGDKSFYYKCIKAGTSGTTEPKWVNVEGTTIVDGGVNWYVYKTVVWQEKGISCEFIPFGNVGDVSGSNPTDITAVGTITTGSWKATPITLTYGGTGATNAKDARANLGATTKFSANVGDGASTTLVVSHNLNTKDIVVSVRETITPSGVVNAEIAIIDSNTITVTFDAPPALNQYRVTVIG